MILSLHDPRPDDMAELARLTAIEPRNRFSAIAGVMLPRPVPDCVYDVAEPS